MMFKDLTIKYLDMTYIIYNILILSLLILNTLIHYINKFINICFLRDIPFYRLY